MVGRAAVEAFVEEAVSRLAPTLQMESLVAGAELVARGAFSPGEYVAAGHARRVSSVTGEQVGEVRFYGEGSANP